MTTLGMVLRQGVERVARYWWVALLFYVVNLGLGLVQTWPLWATGGALQNPFLSQLATGNSSALIDLSLSQGEALAAGTGVWVLVAVLLSLVFGMIYNFLAGGALSVYAGTRPFWAGCRATFWSFTGLGAIIVALVVVTVVVGALVNLVGGLLAASIVTGVLLLLINILGEYARAIAVAQERRNPFVLLGLAVRFCTRKLGGVLVLLLLGAGLAVALTALYNGLANGLRGNIALILVQQLVVLGLIGLKLLRLAWALSYVQHAWPVPAAGTPSPQVAEAMS